MRAVAKWPVRDLLLQRRCMYPALLVQIFCKGDYGFNLFHNSNPQHGGSYARHERRMRDDEVEDFLRSVKGWVSVYDEQERQQEEQSRSVVSSTSEDSEPDSSPPTASRRELGEEAIMRTFTFASYAEAYRFMGRVWAFCYCTDKYPHLTWQDKSITVYLYSPTFRGLSKREARVAAFLNDQYNMVKRARSQRAKLLQNVVATATIERAVGESAAATVAAREAQRHVPLPEITRGLERWTSDVKVEEEGAERNTEKE